MDESVLINISQIQLNDIDSKSDDDSQDICNSSKSNSLIRHMDGLSFNIKASPFKGDKRINIENFGQPIITNLNK